MDDIEVSDSSDDDDVPADEWAVFRLCSLCKTTDTVAALPFRELIVSLTGGRDIDVPHADSITDFEAARAVFKKAVAHLTKALVSGSV